MMNNEESLSIYVIEFKEIMPSGVIDWRPFYEERLIPIIYFSRTRAFKALEILIRSKEDSSKYRIAEYIRNNC